MTTSNKARAAQNEQAVLHAIGLIGWLSAAQVAAWVWGVESPHSARVSADKVLKRLIERGEVKRRESSLRMCVYILTKTGAARANEQLTHQLFRHGYDLSQLDFARQRPAVEYLTEQHHRGKTVLGMAGIRKALEIGMLTDERIKGADGLVINSETDEIKPVLVVRNTHPELIKKAKRIKKVSEKIELIGSAGLIKFFKKELS